MFKKRYAFVLAFPFLFLACAAAKSATEYPLKVRVIQTQWHSSDWGVSGYGKANLYEGDVVKGFDYTYNCLRSFIASQGETFYEARWKKEGSRLILSTVEIGKPTQHSECELSVALQGFVYGVKDGQLITYSRQQWDSIQKDRAMLKASLTPTDTDPSHYPLWVSLLDSQWETGAYGGFKGAGQGNIRLGQQYTAFEFSALCAGKLQNSVGSSGFRGKWIEQSSRLLLLTNNIDSGSKGQCELKTIVRPSYVFIRNSTTGVVSAITQADFQKTIQQVNAANSPAESGGASAQTVSGLRAKVTNSDIIALVASGISVPIIEAKIGASDCSFDTSAESLRQLKVAKVPDAVVLAMINCSSTPSGAAAPSVPPKTTSSSGPDSKLSSCPKDSAAYWDNCTGTLTAAGTTYTGEWQRNKRNGYGIEVENGVVIRKGYWVDGAYKGEAPPLSSTARQTAAGPHVVGTITEKPLTAAATYLLGNDCQRGVARACAQAGRAFAYATNVARDTVSGISMLRKSCDANDGLGCSYLADIYESGVGVAVSKADALVLNGKACSLGIDSACSKAR